LAGNKEGFLPGAEVKADASEEKRKEEKKKREEKRSEAKRKALEERTAPMDGLC
jgi:hypothetical protein